MLNWTKNFNKNKTACYMKLCFIIRYVKIRRPLLHDKKWLKLETEQKAIKTEPIK